MQRHLESSFYNISATESNAYRVCSGFAADSYIPPGKQVNLLSTSLYLYIYTIYTYKYLQTKEIECRWNKNYAALYSYMTMLTQQC